VLGLSHLGLSVADLDAAVEFWSGVMGFEVSTREPSMCFLIHRDARLGIGLTDHGGTVGSPFDEHHTGLDHLALAVPDTAALDAWVRRLDELAVPHSPVVASDGGHHLNLRAPDQFPIELFVMAQATAEAFGLVAPGDAVAHTH
jgi:catechol 2,3-dioxygenase-like lactoylglutathione lyase family enzyme